MRAVTAAQMKAIDAAAVAREGEVALMNAAGEGIARLIDRYARGTGPIVAVALEKRPRYRPLSRPARALSADETDAIAPGEGKGDVLKERVGSKGFGDSLSIYNRRQRLAISQLAVLRLSGNAGRNEGSASSLTVPRMLRKLTTDAKLISKLASAFERRKSAN